MPAKNTKTPSKQFTCTVCKYSTPKEHLYQKHTISKNHVLKCNKNKVTDVTNHFDNSDDSDYSDDSDDSYSKYGKYGTYGKYGKYESDDSDDSDVIRVSTSKPKQPKTKIPLTPPPDLSLDKPSIIKYYEDVIKGKDDLLARLTDELTNVNDQVLDIKNEYMGYLKSATEQMNNDKIVNIDGNMTFNINYIIEDGVDFDSLDFYRLENIIPHELIKTEMDTLKEQRQLTQTNVNGLTYIANN